MLTNYVEQSPWKSRAFCVTWRFTTMVTRVRHCSLSWARWIQFTSSQSISLRSILILSSHLHLGLPNGFLPSGFLTNILYVFLFSPVHATCPTHFILFLELITLIIFGEACKLWSFSLCSLFQPPTTSSFLGPNILLSTLFLNTLNLCSSHSERDQISHPYKTTGKHYSFLYFKPSVFREEMGRQKILNWMAASTPHN